MTPAGVDVETPPVLALGGVVERARRASANSCEGTRARLLASRSHAWMFRSSPSLAVLLNSAPRGESRGVLLGKPRGLALDRRESQCSASATHSSLAFASPRDLLHRSAMEVKAGVVKERFITLASSSVDATACTAAGEPLELRLVRRLPGMVGALGAEPVSALRNIPAGCGTPTLVPPVRFCVLHALVLELRRKLPFSLKASLPRFLRGQPV